MYYFKQNNPYNELLVMFDDEVKTVVRICDYDSESDAYEFAGNLAKLLNSTL